VHPGDTIRVQVKTVEKIGPAWFMKGKVLVRDKVALNIEFACTLM
jgi:3-hydroxymyristoyl/3-hydroxydecanoyl-(acyl carrier protein) dehydratase